MDRRGLCRCLQHIRTVRARLDAPRLGAAKIRRCRLTPLRSALSRGGSSSSRELGSPLPCLFLFLTYLPAASAGRISLSVTRGGVQTPLWARPLGTVAPERSPPTEAVPDTLLAQRRASQSSA